MKAQLISVILGVLFIISPLAIQAKTQKKTISAELYKTLQSSEKLIANKSYRQASAQLQTALAKVDKGSYEQAMILRNLASISALQENYSKAAQYLSKAVASKALSAEQQQQSLLNLGQLYMAAEQYAKAVKAFEPWLARHKADAQTSILLANAYTQLKRYKKALPHVKRAIKLSKKPPEAWYQMQLALYYQLHDYRGAATLLKRQLARAPDNKDYWKQLSSVYHQLKDYKKAATVQHLAYKKGLIRSEKALLELANLFLYVNSPHQAARLLETEMKRGRIKSNSKHWESAANAWTIAREFDKAEQGLQTASKMNSKGSLYQQLGQIYVEKEQWQKAVSALTKAINKGGLKNTGNAYLLLGMSHHELKHHKSANKAFSQAIKYKRTQKSAQQWLNYIAKDKIS